MATGAAKGTGPTGSMTLEIVLPSDPLGLAPLTPPPDRGPCPLVHAVLAVGCLVLGAEALRLNFWKKERNPFVEEEEAGEVRTGLVSGVVEVCRVVGMAGDGDGIVEEEGVASLGVVCELRGERDKLGLPAVRKSIRWNDRTAATLAG
jgi:hypothetical protein